MLGGTAEMGHGGHGGDGLCGGLGHCDAVDLDGIGHVDFGHVDYGDHCGGIDTIDLLGLAHETSPDDHEDVEGSGVMVSNDENVYAMRITSHGRASLKDLLQEAIGRVGLMALQAHRVCGRVVKEDVGRVLPVNAWTGVRKPGRMPSGFRQGMSGSTSMFRLYFQMPHQEWGSLSTPTRDREPGGHFEVGGMTWYYPEVGDYESQFICRFHPRELLVGKQWGTRAGKVGVCRTAAHNVVKAVRSRLIHFEPSKQAAEARRQLNEPKPTEVVRPTPQIRLDVPRSSGTCLLSALLPVPALATVLPTGVDPYQAQVDSLVAAPVVGENMVMVKVSLPPRRKA